MKIQGDAVASAQSGRPTHIVTEEDRHVCWVMDRALLEEMAAWDAKSPEDRRACLGSGAWSTFGSSSDPSAYELHAIVARNTLRNYLGMKMDVPPMSGKLSA